MRVRISAFTNRGRAFALAIAAVQFFLTAKTSRGAVQMTNLFSFPFGAAYGGQPHCQLVRDGEGNLYGTTGLGIHGDYNGTIFKIAPSGTVVWSVPLDGENGAALAAGLVQDRSGNLYGTASAGGHFGLGTVFKISSAGHFLWATSFNGINGANPAAALTEGSDGDFYGSASNGGNTNFGTIFKVSADGRITRLYSFTGQADGAHPTASLCCGPGRDLYGTTSGGAVPPHVGPWTGYVGCGTVFRLLPGGELTTLHAFGAITNSAGVSFDGAYPAAGLVRGRDRCLYGTTAGGGTNDCGTVFKMTSNGSVLWSVSFDGTNGSDPSGSLIQGADGNLYGTTQSGGSNQFFGGLVFITAGTVFKIAPGGLLTSLYSFGEKMDDLGNPLDGAFPYAGLTTDTRGNFYGTTAGGYINPGGIFRLSIASPTVAIMEPHQDHVSGSTVIFVGKTMAKLDTPIADVLYQFNGGSWTEATTTNNWTNWTASVTLAAGKNIFRAYAIDADGGVSRTNSLKLRGSTE